eukprot:01854.XXX_5296_5478_1 [CDS] Oithona nana genome sequencing.
MFDATGMFDKILVESNVGSIYAGGNHLARGIFARGISNFEVGAMGIDQLWDSFSFEGSDG